MRLTKDQVESIKKLKNDNVKFEEEIAKLGKENASLLAQLQSSVLDSEFRTELAELRFDKEALESKLRKFASHCQRLEDDRAAMTDVLRSCSMDLSDFDGDINEAVISLCDRLVSLEEGSSRARSTESEISEEEKNTLERRISDVSKSEAMHSKQVTRYETEIKNLRSRMAIMEKNQSDVNGVNNDMGRKLRFLEQEN